MLEDKINQDLKKALLGGDKLTTATLRMLKSAILYVKVANGGPRDDVLSDESIVQLLRKEAKKRQESADLYIQGGSESRAAAELAEKEIVMRYLPPALDESTIKPIVEAALTELGGIEAASMGALINKVRENTSGSADGALIARIVKERLQQ